MYITIPSAVDDLDVLIARLKRFNGVQLQLHEDRLKILGPVEKLVDAQNYALRYLGPESNTPIHVSNDCFSVFQHADLVRHFEEQFDVIICVKGSRELYLKGRQADIDRFQACLRELETNCCQCPTVLTPFKLENLRLLCQKFSILFHELPPKPSIQMALLIYFSSLLDSGAKLLPKQRTAPLSYMEVYRKPVGESQLFRNNHSSLQDAFLGHLESVPLVLPERARSASARRETKHVSESNLSATSRRLRSVVIDGSNVAFAHGKQQKFSPEGIWLALNFFIKRGHTNVVAVVPRFRRGMGGKLFDKLERAGYLCYSSSRFVNDDHQIADDDKIILQLAIETEAVVVSNDQFRNYRDINEQFRDVIDNRLLPYTMALNTFLIPDDPHGRKGRTLSECLCLPHHTED
ncbi:hypothetical protein X801_05146 [Opisthorchis viverrini]|uniref:RNase NYN domain-containing protein n=2 Tax=Opisthorchis viverrini TaxID=6198 RepID=A0A1S8WWU6_OPIVI|nr:hypothetical protein X801_05146 [Opisthorchis viverrini]